MTKYANFPEILELLKKSRNEELKLNYSHENFSNLWFYTDDGTIDVKYEDNVVCFFNEIMSYFKAKNDSP